MPVPVRWPATRSLTPFIAAFGTELGGKRALIGTWSKLAKDYAAECAQDARENTTQPELTPEEKAALTGSTVAYCA